MTEPVLTAPVDIDHIRRHGAFARVIRNPLGLASLILLVLFLLASILAPLLAPYPPNATDIENVLAPPGGGHILGTDSAGRDVLSRLLYGGQPTFLAAALATAVAILIGVPAGLIAGFYTGKFDSVATWISNMILSLPGIIVLLAAAAAFGPSLWILMTILGILLAPSLFRIVRTSVVAVRKELYVDAARVTGLSDARIIGRHVLYVVRAPLIIMASLIAAITVGVQAGLSFLGIGEGQLVTWGAMLSEGFRNIYLAPLLLVWPAVTISLVSGALALLGNAFRDALEDDEPAPTARRATTPTTPRAQPLEHGGDEAGKNTLLRVSDLTVEYPRPDGTRSTVVDHVGFHVNRGEILGIVGESGSGKSQTAFSILGLLASSASVTDGSIVFDGQELLSDSGRSSSRAISQLRGRRIGYVPQEPLSNLDPAFTVGHQLVRPMVKVTGMKRAEAKRRALELLELVGIPSPDRTFRAYPHEISGGMAQRVLIAGAVSCAPDLIIADEPTTALDVTVQAEVLDLLRGLQRETGMSMLLVTHNFGVVADLCDRVVVMNKSRVVESGSAREILLHPQDPYTQTLIASSLEGKTPGTMLMEARP